MENKFLDKQQIDALKAVEEARERELQTALDKKNAKNNKREKVKKEKEAARKPKSNKPNAFVQILNGDFLTKEFMLNNLNYIFFVIFLLILVVAKGYYGKQLSSDVVETQRELDEITADYFAAKAKLEEDTRRIKLVEELESTGLKETVNPTKVIRINKEK
ncbi:MAG: FtsL-like putative cell division protein [Crocinitomicaceae bacterium]